MLKNSTIPEELLYTDSLPMMEWNWRYFFLGTELPKLETWTSFSTSPTLYLCHTHVITKSFQLLVLNKMESTAVCPLSLSLFAQPCPNFLIQIPCSSFSNPQPTMVPSSVHLKMQSWSWFSLKNLQWLPFLFRIKFKLISMGYTFPVWVLPYLSTLFQPRSTLEPHWDTCSMIPTLAKYLLLLLTSSYLSYLYSLPYYSSRLSDLLLSFKSQHTVIFAQKPFFLNQPPSKPGAFSTLPRNLYTALSEHSSNLIVVVYFLVWFFFSVMWKWDRHR